MRLKSLDQARLRRITMVCGGLLLAFSPIPAITAKAASRSEVAIREVVLSDGARRYSVPITIGGKNIVAGLDTGSTGLRVLPGVLDASDARPGNAGDRYAYGSGIKLEGVIAEGTVIFGASSASLTLQRVDRVGCVEETPHCPANRIPPGAYGLQGDGLPKQGFPAILGISMGNAEVARPLPALGAMRWIVELPRPGETTPGRLILNPDDHEMSGFTTLAAAPSARMTRGGMHDAVTGCLSNLTSMAKACGPVVLDMGAPGIQIRNGGFGSAPWPNLTPAMLAFDGADGQAVLAERFKIGLRAQATRLSFERTSNGEGTAIFSGLAAYFVFTVLYDSEHDTVALRPRPQAPGGAEVVKIGANR